MAHTVTHGSIPAACGVGTCYVRYWIPDRAPRATVQICHGMAEHIARYDELAARLCDEGYLVCGLDYKGHGQTLKEGEAKGFFCAVDGWDYTVQDILTLAARVEEGYPGIPHVLFGHSMGSFLARTVASRHGERFSAFVFEGTSGPNPVVGVAKLIAMFEGNKNGPDKPSALLNKLAFGSYNKGIVPLRTASDWLSRREDVVDKYEADELCGFVFTAQGFYDLFCGLGEIQKKDWAAKVPDKPIFLPAGDADPVGSYGKGVKQVADSLTAAGKTKVQLKLYPGARHEVHNELCAEEFYADLIAWLEKAVG